MKKFKFSLDSVHKVREIAQDRESAVLAELRAEEIQVAERIEHIEAMRREALDKYTRRIASGERVDALELELSSSHFASLDRIQREAEETLLQKKLECDRQVSIVTEAMRKVKVTENLRETQLARHKADGDRQDQIAIDEIVNAVYARRSSGNR